MSGSDHGTLVEWEVERWTSELEEDGAHLAKVKLLQADLAEGYGEVGKGSGIESYVKP